MAFGGVFTERQAEGDGDDAPAMIRSGMKSAYAHAVMTEPLADCERIPDSPTAGEPARVSALLTVTIQHVDATMRVASSVAMSPLPALTMSHHRLIPQNGQRRWGSGTVSTIMPQSGRLPVRIVVSARPCEPLTAQSSTSNSSP